MQGSADISAWFGNERGRRHILQVSTYQAVILLAFNRYPDGAKLTAEVGTNTTNVQQQSPS